MESRAEKVRELENALQGAEGNERLLILAEP